MSGGTSTPSNLIDRWGAAAWVLTGGLWLAAAVATGDQPLAEGLSGMDLGDPAVMLALGGVTATVVSLLETYPTLASRASYLALGGLAASAISAAVNPLLYAVVMLSLRRPEIWELPGAAAFGRLLGFLWMAGLVLYPLGPTLYGAALLRLDERPDTLSYLLFGPLVAWVGLGLPVIVDSSGLDLLGSLVVPMVLAGSFLGIGVLRFRTVANHESA